MTNVYESFVSRATDVPVGDDQVKHIELTRHLANKFNKNYGLFFPKPNAIVGRWYNRVLQF